MKKISIFDTTISDYNLGNQIIMESVYKHLYEIFPEDFFFKLPYMEITKHTISYLKRSDLTFFGGTNSLSGQMERYKQWDLTLRKSYQVRDVILMGIGWWQYQNKTSWYTRILLKNALSKKYYHSARESHTQAKLQEIGIENVINTGCPTLWDLSPEHCKTVPSQKAKHVMLTLTDYHENVTRDKKIIDVLQANYDTIYYWIQGEGDLDYINRIKGNQNIVCVRPRLESYDEALKNPEMDYVGTRLHAGIRALQKGRRALIIGIDNRALEMQKDFNLPVLHQDKIEELHQQINATSHLKINLPNENIARWKNQFK
jgi:polysaccharide pyruvyl transferase WcaK-like protein